MKEASTGLIPGGGLLRENAIGKGICEMPKPILQLILTICGWSLSEEQTWRAKGVRIRREFAAQIPLRGAPDIGEVAGYLGGLLFHQQGRVSLLTDEDATGADGQAFKQALLLYHEYASMMLARRSGLTDGDAQ